MHVVSGMKSCLQFPSMYGNFTVVYKTVMVYGALKYVLYV